MLIGCSHGPIPNTPNREKDRDNVYFWRMNPRRMEAEAVRDSLLYLSGQLDFEMGGPEIPADRGEDLFRRSLYFQHTPDTQMTFLRLWDAASPNECFRRNESITPHQALSLSNSKISLQMSRVLTGILNDKGRAREESRHPVRRERIRHASRASSFPSGTGSIRELHS